MTQLSIRIPGRFIDAHLYGEHLYAFDHAGRLSAFSLRSIADQLARATSMSRSAANALVVDQKLLSMYGCPVDPAMRSIAEDASRSQSASTGPIELAAKSLQQTHLGYTSDAFVLDMMISYWTIFVSTEDGLFSLPISADEEISDDEPKLRLNQPCRMSSARWGAVTASCLQSGTWSLLSEVSGLPTKDRRREQVSEVFSSRHAWAGGSLFAYDSATTYNVFKANIPKKPKKKRKKGDRRVVDGFSMERDLGLLDPVAANSLTPEPERKHRQFVTTLGTTLFGINEGQCYVNSLSNWGGQIHSVDGLTSLGRVDGRPEAVVETDGGYVVETRAALSYVSRDGVSTAADVETISLRSYPQSRRFRRAITATTDSGLVLSVLLGDHPFPKSQR